MLHPEPCIAAARWGPPIGPHAHPATRGQLSHATLATVLLRSCQLSSANDRGTLRAAGRRNGSRAWCSLFFNDDSQEVRSEAARLRGCARGFPFSPSRTDQGSPSSHPRIPTYLPAVHHLTALLCSLPLNETTPPPRSHPSPHRPGSRPEHPRTASSRLSGASLSRTYDARAPYKPTTSCFAWYRRHTHMTFRRAPRRKHPR